MTSSGTETSAVSPVGVFALLEFFSETPIPSTTRSHGSATNTAAVVPIIKSASLVVAVLDHSKFGREALGTIATLEQVDILLTDREPADPFKDALEAAGVRLLIADDEAL